MRAVVMEAFGSVDVLKLTDMPRPEPGDSDLLVEVCASSMNPVDFKIREGMFGESWPLPCVLGFDVSGVVRGVGANVSDFKEGDEIYALASFTRHGAHAEYMLLDARLAAHKPKNLSHAEAAALPLVTLTAWEALISRANIKKGQTVLIHAGAGGVGHMAVQIAKNKGCRVITTSGREESLAFCREIGADLVLNYKTDNVVESVKNDTKGQGCPVVFDTVGGTVFEQCFECLAVNGQLVSIVPEDCPTICQGLFMKNATLHYEFVGAAAMYSNGMEAQKGILKEVTKLVEAGKLKPHVSTKLLLDQVPKGHNMQETGRTIGKTVILVSQEN